MVNILSVNNDEVIKGKFVTAVTDYRFAIEKLVSLMDKLEIQRKLQNAKFYQRLEKDLSIGCIMPPLTIAFLENSSRFDDDNIADYINDNIGRGFVLDGIQRLNTLSRAHSSKRNLDLNRPIFLNIIICPSMDNLLYRMITLNNGQKPMSARHQIEILTANLYDFESLSIKFRTEKESGQRGSFNKSDLIKGYISFLSNSTNIDNQKIIEEKMDELIAEKILHSNITQDGIEFSNIIELMSDLIDSPYLLDWFRVSNNLIGFCVGIRNSYFYLKDFKAEEFEISIKTFESSFSSFDVSKIRLGAQRRKAVAYFVANYSKLRLLDENELLDILSEIS
ncbi:hypothetical protein EON83_03770 [bacterium]|nr:MAG: hypothetical protein EON83_03770 [bacterium]